MQPVPALSGTNRALRSIGGIFRETGRAVERIPDKGESRKGQMNADLMRPSGEDRHFHDGSVLF